MRVGMALVAALIVLIVCFAGLTLLALESGGVVTVRTTDADSGLVRTPRIWFVEHADNLYLEAGHPNNPWVRDLARVQQLRLDGQGLDGDYSFQIGREAAEHQLIRRLMQEKYGWRDWWIGLVFDTSASQLVTIQALE